MKTRMKQQTTINETKNPQGSLTERIIRLPELMNLTSLSRASAYRMIANDVDFPKPIKIGSGKARNCAVGFSLNEVQHWITKQTEKRSN